MSREAVGRKHAPAPPSGQCLAGNAEPAGPMSIDTAPNVWQNRPHCRGELLLPHHDLLRRYAMTRLLCLVVLIAPGALLAGLAVAADFVGLGRSGSGGFGTRQAGLLTVGLLMLLYAALVDRKAVKDFRASGRSYLKTVLFLVVPTLVVLGASLMIADRVIGLVQPPGCPTAGVNFPPNSTTTIETSEFSFTIESNSIGIRDREPAPRQDAGYRVLAIGDSFTYGWGVAQDQTWPKVAEARLRAAGCPGEVLNLGYPGASPRKYATIAREAIPLLKPDLVLVAILQGNDLKQLDLEDSDRRFLADLWLQWFFPNFVRVRDGRCFQKPEKNPAAGIKAQWQEAARRLQQTADPVARQRFDQLDAQVRQALLAGDLNPCAVELAIRNPDFYSFTLHGERAEVQAATATLAACLREICRAARRVGAKVEVVSVPSGAYVCRSSWRTIRRLGFSLDEDVLDDDRPDGPIQTACQQAGVAFHSVMPQVRKAAQVECLYFELDDHFNSRGQAVYGETVADLILQRTIGDLPR